MGKNFPQTKVAIKKPADFRHGGKDEQQKKGWSWPGVAAVIGLFRGGHLWG